MIQNIHDRLQEYINGQHIAGASIRVRRGSEIVHNEYIGYADIANEIPVDEKTLFRMASMTKPVIGVAIMMMAEQGKLAITDPVEKYIPEFADMRVAAKFVAADAKDADEQVANMEYEPLKRSITIEDMLRHRSGIGHGPVSFKHGVLKSEPGMTLTERIANIASCPLDFQPGEYAGYSGVTAFDVLGRVLEVVSGKELSALLDEMLFIPLGMKETTFFPDDAMKARVPRLYERKDEKLVDTAPAAEFGNPLGFDFPCGSAGLYSTLDDYDKFVQMLAQKGVYGGIQFLKAETIAEIAALSPDDPAKRIPSPTWGLSMHVFNLMKNTGRPLSAGTFGWSGAFGTHFYVDPVADICMTLMVNRADIGGAGSYVSLGMEEEIFKSLVQK